MLMTRRLRAILIVAAMAAGLPLAALALGSPQGTGVPSDALWRAIVAVESRGDVNAYNAHDGATGMAQIRSVCLEDANRIAGLRGMDERFSAADRSNPRAARRIWNLYLDFYGKQDEKETGLKPTDEVFARIWNGGPSGWRKTSTLPYWNRIREALRAAPSEAASPSAE